MKIELIILEEILENKVHNYKVLDEYIYINVGNIIESEFITAFGNFRYRISKSDYMNYKIEQLLKDNNIDIKVLRDYFKDRK